MTSPNFAITGLPGSGKTALATAAAERFGDMLHIEISEHIIKPALMAAIRRSRQRVGEFEFRQRARQMYQKLSNRGEVPWAAEKVLEFIRQQHRAERILLTGVRGCVNLKRLQLSGYKLVLLKCDDAELQRRLMTSRNYSRIDAVQELQEEHRLYGDLEKGIHFDLIVHTAELGLQDCVSLLQTLRLETVKS